MSIRPIDTCIANPTGIFKIGEMKPGDAIFSLSGGLLTISSVRPHDPVEFYRITFDDGRNISVCADQQLLVLYYQDNHPRVERLRVADIMKDYRLPIKYDQKYLYKYTIPSGYNVEFSHRDYIIDPYAAGVMMNAACPDTRHLALTHVAPVVVQRVCMLCGMEYELDLDLGIYWLFDRVRHKKIKAKKFLKPLQIYKVPMCNRSISVEYVLNDIEVVVNFVQGFIDSSRYKISTPEEYAPMYATTSEKMFQELTFINRSLGLKTFTERDSNGVYLIYVPRDNYPPIGSLVIQDIQSIGEKDCMSILSDNKNNIYLSDDFIPIPIPD